MNTNQIKAREIENQREFVTTLVNSPSKSGSASWIFFGDMFAETIAYLKKEGFKVKKVSDGDSDSHYLPVYRIVCVGKKEDGNYKTIEQEIAEDESGWLGILYTEAHLP